MHYSYNKLYLANRQKLITFFEIFNNMINKTFPQNSYLLQQDTQLFKITKE